MKKLLKLVTVAFLMIGFATTTSYADVAKGQKLYLKKLKKKCGINGSKMAAKHTQSEWEKIGKAGLEAEIIKICPKVKSVKGKYIDHLYDFFHNYASDSGNVPSC